MSNFENLTVEAAREAMRRLMNTKPHIDVLAFDKPRKLTFDSGDKVTLATIGEVAAFVASSSIPDDVTCRELAQDVLDKMAELEKDPKREMPKLDNGWLVIDRPWNLGDRNVGQVSRKQRDENEKRALLNDPKLPHDIRNQYEAELGLAITPGPPPLPEGYKFPLPQVLGQDGEIIPHHLFEITQDTRGNTRLVWRGKDALGIGRLFTGTGDELPVPAAFRIAIGGDINVPLSAAKLGKVQAVGLLFRDGKVARDTPPTEEQAAADVIAEADLLAQTQAEINVLVDSATPYADILHAVRKRSWREPSAKALIEGEFARRGLDLGAYLSA